MLNYTKNDDIWERNEERFAAPSLCRTKPYVSTSLTTVDFAVLETLPRLYYVDQTQRCIQLYNEVCIW